MTLIVIENLYPPLYRELLQTNVIETPYCCIVWSPDPSPTVCYRERIALMQRFCGPPSSAEPNPISLTGTNVLRRFIYAARFIVCSMQIPLNLTEAGVPYLKKFEPRMDETKLPFPR